MADNTRKDDVTGVETTGHEWDGIEELNNPAPRWWLWVFYLTIIWSIGYWVVYPAWPTLSGEGERGGTKGSFGWTQYTKLKEEQAEIIARKAEHLERFNGASLEDIKNDPALYEFAMAGGAAAFKDNCATCHGAGGMGGAGYPNLNDDDWLWGGSLEEIYTTIRYGIRSDDEDTRSSMMPPLGDMLSSNEIRRVSEYVYALSHEGAINPKGEALFAQHCASCHGEDAKGKREMGAPNLADAIWLKSEGNVAAIASQIRNPKHGIMPALRERLDDTTIRMLTVYVHSLGGGEASTPQSGGNE